MRDSLFRVVKELEDFSDTDRITEAAVLQDEFREAMTMVTRIREAAAEKTVERYGLTYASELTGTPVNTLQGLAEGFRR